MEGEEGRGQRWSTVAVVSNLRRFSQAWKKKAKALDIHFCGFFQHHFFSFHLGCIFSQGLSWLMIQSTNQTQYEVTCASKWTDSFTITFEGGESYQQYYSGVFPPLMLKLKVQSLCESSNQIVVLSYKSQLHLYSH